MAKSCQIVSSDLPGKVNFSRYSSSTWLGMVRSVRSCCGLANVYLYCPVVGKSEAISLSTARSSRSRPCSREERGDLLERCPIEPLTLAPSLYAGDLAGAPKGKDGHSVDEQGEVPECLVDVFLGEDGHLVLERCRRVRVAGEAFCIE